MLKTYPPPKPFSEYLIYHASSVTYELNSAKVKKAFKNQILNSTNFKDFIGCLKSHGLMQELFRPKFEEFMLNLFDSHILDHQSYQYLLRSISNKREIFALVSSSKIFKKSLSALVIPFKDFVDIFSTSYELQKFLYYGRYVFDDFLKDEKRISAEDLQYLMSNLKFALEIEEFFKTTSLVKYALECNVVSIEFLNCISFVYGSSSLSSVVKSFYQKKEFLDQHHLDNEVCQSVLSFIEQYEKNSKALS